MKPKLQELLNDQCGSAAVIFGLALLPTMMIVGGAIDYTKSTAKKAALQQALDAGTLAAARNSQASSTYLANVVNANLTSKGGGVSSATLTTETASDGSITYKGDTSVAVGTSFLKLIGLQSVNVSAHSEVTMANQSSTGQDARTEIALVLDVSSSMIEESRFAPMQSAVQNFIDVVSNQTTGLKNWKISVVPFSSRINFGIEHSDLRMAWNEFPVTPTRWTNPASTYSSSSYSKVQWVDGVNFAMYNGKNYYWMGCVEPRLDFAVHTGGSTTTAIGEEPPLSMLFVPMDDNPQSGKSFCPPPVTPLSSDASGLKSIISALTSQGSTRLDAGMLGGWYTLSPKWSSTWPSSAGASAYGAARKYVVFMTDGRMNTQDEASAKAYDWVCEAGGNCDAYANNALVSTCDAMKAAGVTIFTISYDKDADASHIKSCASSSDLYYTANSAETGETAIKSVYATIAAKIVKSASPLRLSR